MMERVVPTAESLGAKTFRPLTEVTVESCANFVSRSVNNGKRGFDIGIEEQVARTRYYAAEAARLSKMGFQRVERGTIEIKSQTLKLYEWIKVN